AESATTVAASAEPSRFGQPVTFTATVNAIAPGGGTPTGTATFTIDGLARPSVALSDGQASVTIAALSVGNHSISVAYSGDDNFNGGTRADLSQTVKQADTTITFSSSANPSVFGQPATITVAVAAVDPGAGMPTGTVTFTI